MPDDCLFCDPSRSRILTEDHGWYVRYDEYPATPGHVEVVPRRHVTSTDFLTPGDWAMLADAITCSKDLIAKHHGLVDGFNIGINDGPAAGQTIPHLHIHVIPRHFGDQDDPRGGIRRGLPNGDPDLWGAKETRYA